MSTNIPPEVKNKIIALCKAIIPDAAIWLYGSRARLDHSPDSDIDLALQAPQPIDYFKIAELKEVLQATNIPYAFDIIDLNAISQGSFKDHVEKEMILWKK